MLDSQKRMRSRLRKATCDAAYNAFHLGICARHLTRRSPLSPTRFIIFGRGRSGSTALVNLLHQVPDIHCDGEILHHPVLFPRLHVDAMCSRSASVCYGCKILSIQLRAVQSVEYGDAFLSRLFQDGYKILYLKRNDLLRHALSNMNARTFQFHQKKRDSSRCLSSITVDPQEVMKWIKGSESLEAYEREVLKNVPHLPLTYEQDLENEADHQATVDRICGFLGIRSAVVECEYRKITPKFLREFIANYEELISYLESTPYARYLTSVV